MKMVLLVTLLKLTLMQVTLLKLVMRRSMKNDDAFAGDHVEADYDGVANAGDLVEAGDAERDPSI